MNPETWTAALDLFRLALEVEPERRPGWLAARAEPAEVRAAVERMLAEDAREHGPLDARPGPSVSALGGAPAVLELGSLVGGYRIRGVIASGGTSTVYLAEQERPRRRVALKTLRPGGLSEAGLRRFALEAEILGELRHPGIAEIYESGLHRPDGRDAGDALPFIAMEYVAESRDLARHAAGLDARGRLELFLRVCEAVHHAHQKGVVHRDLKPSNVLVDEHGTPKVIDFGLARVTDGGRYQVSLLRTESGRAAGTLYYMSPEQLAGRRDAIDVRSDVWALGVILFELLSGRHPFAVEEHGPAGLARLVGEAEPRRLGTLEPRLRGELEWICARALERERERRYASVHELALDVRRHLAHEPVSAGPPSGWYRARKLVRRHRLAFGVGAAVLLVALVGLSTTLWQASLAHRRLEERNLQLRIASQTGDVLQRALLAATPAVARGSEPTLREFVDAIARELEREAGGEAPLEAELELELRETLGATYAGLGRFAQALAHLERARELAAGLWGERDARSLALENQALDAALHAKAGAPLEPRLLRSRERARDALGAAHPVAVRAGYNLARLAFARGDRAGSRALLEEGIGALEGSAEQELRGSLRRLLAEVEVQEGDVGAARAQAALASAGGELDPLHPDRLAADKAEVALLLSEGRIEQGLRAGAPLLGRMRRVLGEQHPETLALRSELGHALAVEGRTEAALEHLVPARAARALLASEPSRSGLHALVVAGSAYVKLGRPEEARPLLAAALETIEPLGDEARFLRSQAMLGLGNASLLEGDLEAARAWLSDGLRGAREELGPDHFLTLMLESSLAQQVGRSGDLAAAIETMEEVARRSAAAYGEDDVHHTLLFRSNLGVFLLEAGRLARAEEVLRDVLERRERRLGLDHGDVLETRHALAQVLWRRSRPEESLALFEDVARRRLERGGAGHHRTRMAVADLAGVLNALGRAEEAERWRARLEDEPPSASQ